MRRSHSFLLIAVLGTLLGMALDAHGPIGARLYPPAAGGVEPAGLQTPFVMGSVLVQAIGIGVGLALLPNAQAFIDTLARMAGGRRGIAVLSLLSLEWILVSWIPHVGLHQHVSPSDFWALGSIEWGFHATLVGAGLILVRFLYVANAAGSHTETRTDPMQRTPTARIQGE